MLTAGTRSLSNNRRSDFVFKRASFDRVRIAMQVGESSQYFVGWGTLAFINAGLAQGKHRSGLNWFLLSVLLGPLATLILLFVD
jgi:hypothetical protein